MTGQMRNLSGASMTADHERRIRELERRLNVGQSNLPRRVSVSIAFAHYEASTFTPAATGNSTLIAFDTLVDEEGAHGITLSAGTFTLPPGLWTVSAGVHYPPNGTGFRSLHLTGTVAVATGTYPPILRVPAVTDALERSIVDLSVPVRSAAGADQVGFFGLQTSGGSLNMQGRYATFLRHS